LKVQKSNIELTKDFWEAHEQTLFDQKTIAAVLCINYKTLEMHRWKEIGIKYIRIGRHILYRKIDVIKYIDDHMVSFEESLQEEESLNDNNKTGRSIAKT